MIRSLKCCILSAALFLSTDAVQAGIITFDFGVTGGAANSAGNALDDLSFGTTSVVSEGITVTLAAAANTGVFNLLAGPDFGIDAAEIDPFDDVSDAFDNGTGVPEVMTLIFSTSAPATIDFVSIDFDRITTETDEASLAFDGGSTFSITRNNTTNMTSGLFLLPTAESVANDQAIQLSWVAGLGFGLEQITLDVTAVPEPSSIATLFAFGLFGIGRRRKRQA